MTPHTFVITSGDMARCPIRSISPSHYNDDGTCKCPPRCAFPDCGEPIDKGWSRPGTCKRVAGHDGAHVPMRNPTNIGDPWYGRLRCHVCGHLIYADEPHRKVVRFSWLPGRGGWCNSFAHDTTTERPTS